LRSRSRPAGLWLEDRSSRAVSVVCPRISRALLRAGARDHAVSGATDADRAAALLSLRRRKLEQAPVDDEHTLMKRGGRAHGGAKPANRGRVDVGMAQPGIALQHSLAPAALVSARHIEVNRHHFVGGFTGASSAEQARFATVDRDLYRPEDGLARLRIRDGRISLFARGSRSCRGLFAGLGQHAADDGAERRPRREEASAWNADRS
jgi:hypothetical protein